MGCLSGIIKYLVFIFNFLIAICGLILISFGALILTQSHRNVSEVTNYSIGGYAVGVGVFIFLVAFFGCCGAIKENSCMLTTYAVILITLFIIQIVLGALAFVAIRNNDGQWNRAVDDAVKEIFNKYHEDPKTVDEIQQDLECCGVRDASYWGTQLPWSCCKNSTTGTTPLCTIDHAFKDGCSTIISDFLESNIKIIGGVALGFAIIELVGAIFACVIKNRR